jgi:hypothetical protein
MAALEDPAGYRLYLEADTSGADSLPAVADDVDARLGTLNIEWASKRRSGRLARLEIVPLAPGTADVYRAACVRAGQREGQLKPPALAYRRALVLDLDAHVARSRSIA